ncbi:3-deoxy-7-phosphoheptulonate synthase [Pseudomonas sp. BMS12]|uniref:3-deoxy-7-phosphoheptulonate synthase n=1 Tax=Pseudomonas sp. BMS12 TaxID=1796033 RepID=UPI00083A9FF1|nr:3-deoxy-7-phosphoheptulonate synthase [Pseudomonas sp. BMS12]
MNAPLNIVATAKSRAETLPTPAQLRQQLPLDPLLAERVHQQRAAIRAILTGRDPRLLVVIGPCSLHDPVSALDYGQRLAALQEEVGDQLLLVMRAYLEKPRTTVGWKGLLFDPHLDGSGAADEGLRLSRGLLLDLLRLGLPLASELLQPMAAAYIDDLLGWAAIGARTSESQVHREMVSGLDLPVGFKNGTDGGLTIACDAMQAAAQGHRHFGMDEHGRPALLHSPGNPHTHLVLRGGHQGANYSAEQIAAANATLTQRGLQPSIMVDCSHANSGKDPARQPDVLHEVVRQRLTGDLSLRGVMLESHLEDGCQPLQQPLRYGQSITDACLGWRASEALLREAAARLRRGF